MFQTGFLTGVSKCVIGPISPWWTVINHTFAVRSCLVVIVGRVYMQMHGVQWGCLISETHCFDCNLVSQLMKNQLLAMSRIKSNICLLWFHNRFQYCLKKLTLEVIIFPSETHSVIADESATALASVCRHGLQLCSPSFCFSCKGWLTVSEIPWVREK